MASTRMKMNYEDFAPYFEYKDGKIVRKVTFKKSKAGDVIGTYDAKGYLKVGHLGKSWAAHRVAYLLNHGYCPDFVDHINGIKDDNRIENLREANISTNHYNCKKYTTNKSGIKNVYWHSSNKRWAVRINKKHIGCFEDLELAELVAFEARNKYHGEYANHGGLL
jgi:hypothetical protein